jgi:hypothetical protein
LTAAHRGTLRFPTGDLAGIEAGFVSALQQTFSVTGTTDAIEADGSWSRGSCVRRLDRPVPADADRGGGCRVALGGLQGQDGLVRLGQRLPCSEERL